MAEGGLDGSLSFLSLVREGKQRSRGLPNRGEQVWRQGREPCQGSEALLILSELKLEGLDVEAVREFIPNQEGV